MLEHQGVQRACSHLFPLRKIVSPSIWVWSELDRLTSMQEKLSMTAATCTLHSLSRSDRTQSNKRNQHFCAVSNAILRQLVRNLQSLWASTCFCKINEGDLPILEHKTMHGRHLGRYPTGVSETSSSHMRL